MREHLISGDYQGFCNITPPFAYTQGDILALRIDSESDAYKKPFEVLHAVLHADVKRIPQKIIASIRVELT